MVILNIAAIAASIIAIILIIEHEKSMQSRTEDIKDFIESKTTSLRREVYRHLNDASEDFKEKFDTIDNTLQDYREVLGEQKTNLEEYKVEKERQEKKAEEDKARLISSFLAVKDRRKAGEPLSHIAKTSKGEWTVRELSELLRQGERLGWGETNKQ